VIGGKLLDLGVGSRFLATKLVAREPDDFQALRGVRFVDLGELGVVDLGQASGGRHVNDQGHFALVFAQADVISVNVFMLETVDVCRLLSHAADWCNCCCCYDDGTWS